MVRFDPRLLSGRDDLFLAFLQELRARVDPAGDAADRERSLAGKIAGYSESVSPALNLLAAGAGAAAGGAARAAGIFLNRQQSLDDRRKGLASALETAGCPNIVLIDELDRVAGGPLPPALCRALEASDAAMHLHRT